MSPKKRKNDFLIQGSILAAAGIITRFIGLIYRAPLTRIVGSEGMAYYNTAYELYNLALLLSTYSLPVAVSKLISVYESKKQYKNSYQIFLVAVIVAFVAGGTFSVLLFVFADPLAAAMGWPSAAVPLKVLAPTIFIFSIMGVLRGFFQGKKTMVVTAFSQLVEQVVNAAVSIIAALLLVNAYKDTVQAAAYGAAGGTMGTLFGAFAGMLFLFAVFRLNKSLFLKQKKKDTVGVTETNTVFAKLVLMTMLPIILSQSVYQLSGLIDNAMFGRIMDSKNMIESERAILWEAYSNRYKWLSNVPVAVSSAFGVSIVPLLIGSFTEGDMEKVRYRISSSIKLNMMIAIPAAVGLAALAHPIIILIFGDTGETISESLMQLGAVAVIFFALSTLTNGVLQGINRLKLPVIHAALSLGVHVVLVYVLVNVLDFGAYGLVIGNVTYALLVCILNWLAIRRLIDYRQEIKRTFLLPLAASLIMGITAFLVYKGCYSLISINSISVVIAIGVALVVYFVMLIVLKAVTRQELLDLPKGAAIVRLAEKLHLIRKDKVWE